MSDTRRIVYITMNDRKRLKYLLQAVVEKNRLRFPEAAEYLSQADEDLDHAVVVHSEDIPPDIVTINSTIRFRSLPDGHEQTATLVFPGAVRHERERISVVSPLGLALLGKAVGDTVRYEAPGGLQEVVIIEILYQPEAAHDYTL